MIGVPLLLLTDARFPTGGYAHSGGLEAAVADGLGPAGVPAFTAGRLRGVGLPDACLAVHAARAARRDDLDTLLALEREALARTPSPPLRAAARRLGAQLLRTAAVVWPDASMIDAYRSASRSPQRPVAFGVVAAAAGLSDRELAYALLYEDAAGIVSAVVKLLPVDAADAARWLLDLEPQLAELALRAEDGELPGGFAPALELRSLAHARRDRRLFAT